MTRGEVQAEMTKIVDGLTVEEQRALLVRIAVNTFEKQMAKVDAVLEGRAFALEMDALCETLLGKTPDELRRVLAEQALGDIDGTNVHEVH